MNFVLSAHAKEKIEKRKIPVELIDIVFRNPQQSFRQDDLTVLQSIVETKGKNYLLRLFVNTLKEPNIIITVYLTNKISKYWKK